ncbi:hybrid sensor histidine kinase/response regulator [Sessilibacter corallicola]|uniref:hybrid sensor histidine kinase/response regulator n=1 Tax=Sessilibacter corallicola TaxID=2904075 RepID=UPI001E476C5C|nr:ATP-binding protein [Sessilibacter corallicola]MCE2027570.1 ATP-binding protein [Sessilibacter corallicola]
MIANYSASARILITDDNLINLGILNKILSSEFSQIEKAHDGEQCLAAVQQKSFDLLLLDMNMPNLSGMEVIEAIAKLPRNRQPRIMVVSADHSPETVANAFLLGADDYLKTPYSKEELLARVTTQLALRSRSQYLEELVNRRTRELTETNQRLKETHSQLMQAEKMASLGQLAAGVAHEINNPLAYVNSNLQMLDDYCKDIGALIQAYSELLVDKKDDKSFENIAQLTRKINPEFLFEDINQILHESLSGVKRVKKIVNDLKTFSHPEQKIWQQTDINQSLDSAINIANSTLKYKARINKEIEDLPPIDCIAPQINQVFVNLLVNAAQSIQDRGEITIVTQALNNESIQVKIADTGIGIDKENQSKIFDPFYTTKPVGEGTGLGLSVSYGIIQAHNGTIKVDSKKGEGTTFTITLPIQRN